MSKIKIPCDNGPYRDGKGSLHEGGTRVVALANRPKHIEAGITLDAMIHVVDMYPTLAGLGDAPIGKSKPLDGLNVWPTIAKGKPSPRTEIVYNVEPFRAGIREGDWKLIWRTPLPEVVELYDIAHDPSERTMPRRTIQKSYRAAKASERTGITMAKPLLLQAEFGAMRERLHMPSALPGEGGFFQ